MGLSRGAESLRDTTVTRQRRVKRDHHAGTRISSKRSVPSGVDTCCQPFGSPSATGDPGLSTIGTSG